MLSYVLAAAIAALIAVVELRSRLVCRFTFRGWVWLWWLLRLALEGTIGAAAVTLVGTGGRPAVLVGVIGGIAGPSFVRWTIEIPGDGEGKREVGVGRAYEPIRDFFERSIEEISATEQGRWISDSVLPIFRKRQIGSSYVADRLGWYIKALALDPPARDAALRFIMDVAEDSSEEEEKVKTLVLYAIEQLRAYRFVRGLVRTAHRLDWEERALAAQPSWSDGWARRRLRKRSQ